MMLRRTSLVRLLHLGPAFKPVVHVNSIVARNPDEGLLLGLREPDATCDDNGAACEKMSVNGNSRTWRDVLLESALRAKADTR